MKEMENLRGRNIANSSEDKATVKLEREIRKCTFCSAVTTEQHFNGAF